MGEHVQVDLTALTTFAHTLGTLADGSITQALGYGANINGLGQMIATETATAAEFAECQSFVAYHQLVADSAQKFLADALRGVSSLGAGAEVCAINYAGTDQFNAAKLQQISADMKAGGHFAPIDFILHGNATVNSDSVRSAFTPTGDQGLWSSGGTPGPTAAPGMSKADLAKSDQDFRQLVEQDKQLLLDNKPVDPKKLSTQNGQAMTIGKGDTAIQVPGDQPGGSLTPTAPDTLVTG
jgi:hypothetical protein